MRTSRILSHFTAALAATVTLLGGVVSGVSATTTKPVATSLSATTKLRAASTPAGGSIKFWATPTSTGASDLVITGAIGDFGKSLNTNKAGSADPNGDYAVAILRRGTIELDQTGFRALVNKASFPIDKASCSSEGSVTGSASVFNGTGAYTGISGRVSITITFVWIISPDTTCSGNNKILLHAEYITGTGTVRFS